jgi:hypothetical protein
MIRIGYYSIEPTHYNTQLVGTLPTSPVLLGVNADRPHFAKMPSMAAHYLRTLHGSLPKPITDPGPTIKLPAEGLSTSTTPTQPRYIQGNVWPPDTYSLGPAPAALAGSQAFAQCMELLLSDFTRLKTSLLLGCLDLMSAMTKLARDMASEAAGLC